MDTQLFSACTLCQSVDIHPVLEKSHDLFALDLSVTQQYVFCAQCQFLFVQNPLTATALTAYYDANTQERDYPIDLPTARHIADQIAFLDHVLLTKDRSLLEIGPNSGFFLDGLNDRGDMELYYVETSAVARGVLKRKKYLHEFDPVSQPNRLFDVLTLLHTLEHIPEPQHFLAGLTPHLADDGTIFIEVPDFSFVATHTDDVQFEHVNYFSLTALTALFRNIGFVIVAAESTRDANYPACTRNILRVAARRATTSSAEKTLLSEREDLQQKPFRKLEQFVQALPTDARIALYPASWLTYACLQRTSIRNHNIVGVFDRNRSKWGRTFSGYLVQSPEELMRALPTYTLVLNEGSEQVICNDLVAMGIPKDSLIGWSRFV